MTTKRRRLILAAAVGLSAAAVVVMVGWQSPEPVPARRTHAAAKAEVPAPYHVRADYPAGPTEPEMPPPGSPPSSAGPSMRPHVTPNDTLVGHPSPVPAAQSAGGWATELRDATCACKTRACARGLQDGFIGKLQGMTYDEARDGEAYAEAARQTIRCYNSLPDDS